MMEWLTPPWTLALEVATIRQRNQDDSEEPIMMRNVPKCFGHVRELVTMLLSLIADALRYMRLCLRPSPALAAENLFLRKQLALYQEHQIKPRQATNAIRLAMVWLSRWFNWRSALSIVTPETFTRWHRQGFRWFWHRKSKPGRPSLPKDLQALIRRMALENPSWGQEHIANELLLKLGLKVSPRTVRKYMPDHCVGSPGKRRQTQCWSTFIRNHAKGIVACDFCVAVTATFRLLYVFVVIEHASRRLLHVNVTAHPTGPWTLQQFREAIPADHPYCILIHDRDTIFSKAVDQNVRHMGLRVLKTPARTPVANSICERVLGSLRRECLDFLIPLNERHLYGMLKEWVGHYNQDRPHMSLGPGIPMPIRTLPVSRQAHRHPIPAGQRVVARPVLGGLHHDYRFASRAA
jgi:transposase InsO family protein